LIDPRVSIPTAAELLDDALDLVAWNVGRALEIHVLDPVRHAGEPWVLVLRSDVVPTPRRGERRGVFLADKDGQSVVVRRAAIRRPMKGDRGRGHQFIIKSMDT